MFAVVFQIQALQQVKQFMPDRCRELILCVGILEFSGVERNVETGSGKKRRKLCVSPGIFAAIATQNVVFKGKQINRNRTTPATPSPT